MDLDNMFAPLGYIFSLFLSFSEVFVTVVQYTEKWNK